MDRLASDKYDFTRCLRPNGTAYGTSGKCKKGVEVDPLLMDRKLTEQQIANMDTPKLQEVNSQVKGAIKSAVKNKLSVEQVGHLKSNLKATDEELATRDRNSMLRVENDKRNKLRRTLQMRLRELQDKMDDAATMKEQARYSTAIADLTRRLGSEDLKTTLDPREIGKVDRLSAQ